MPIVSIPPLSAFEMRLSCSSRSVRTSAGAIGRNAPTMSPIKFVRGKKLASARMNRTAGNRARKK
jgi:hypothetical protein